mmetsp:Transcript_36380/g.87869  ORF Transcript_36380/g.87869 Transcript_36380/m.87869 type:complete len:761 (+) Transcript_36380:1179-3461(+)
MTSMLATVSTCSIPRRSKVLLSIVGRRQFNSVPPSLSLPSSLLSFLLNNHNNNRPSLHHHHQQQKNHHQQQPVQQKKMSFHFASSDYAKAFQHLPTPDVPALKESALTYLDNFNEQSWYDDPIASLLNGTELRGGQKVDTINALGQVNGRQEYATSEQVQALKNHIMTYKSSSNDLRAQLRRIEQQFLTKYSGFLIGNQCIDFQKQDGVTELEESVMANHVERNLNDLVLKDEIDGKIIVNRQPIYVSAVSNFTNFLDLFRKTIRSMELGIPVVILGRSNTVQHSYRWTKLLVELCKDEGIDTGMVTYLSCPLEDIKDITQSCQDKTGNLYSTCSRELAKQIKSGYPNTVASTGGPNTLVTTEWTPQVKEAIRMSATIESSGQCTALRHVVAPVGTTVSDVSKMLDEIQPIDQASDSLRSGGFDGIFENHKGSAPGPSENDGYQRHEKVDASFRVAENLPPNDIEEYWRKVVVDVSAIDIESKLQDLADWLNTNQPISLGVNGKTREQSIEIGVWLWEHTGLVVNTIGSPDSPALTCQARPQEGEVFGEFPPRKLLDDYTKYPVVVPSATPGYDSSYSDTFLDEQAKVKVAGQVGEFIEHVENPQAKGYLVTLYSFLLDACIQNPKRGFGSSRTAVWGLQRPPTGTTTYLACNTKFDDLAPSLLVFFATNAKEQVVVVSEQAAILDACAKYGIKTQATFDKGSLSPGDNYKEIKVPMQRFPMVGNFIATLFPVGHIKSTLPNDEEFVAKVSPSDKWLRVE